MNITDPRPGGRPHGKPEPVPRDLWERLPLLRLARRVGAVITEVNDAQRRMASLTMAYDRYLPEPDVAPENYAEFLLRTSGPLLHEPSAARRLTGKHIR
jgi:hypothetical protein